MTWQEFKAEVEKQLQEREISLDTEVTYLDLYPSFGIHVHGLGVHLDGSRPDAFLVN